MPETSQTLLWRDTEITLACRACILNMLRIVVDRNRLDGTVNVLDCDIEARPPRPDLARDPQLPPETRLWAQLQHLSGGIWGGCVYDVDKVIEALRG